MNSCLYQCEVMHHRLMPREHKFRYKIFMFYFDLDEIDFIGKKFRMLSHNRFNWFNFRDRDHYISSHLSDKKSVKENILRFLADAGIEIPGAKVMLLTNVATLGYSFNPISFYLCFDADGSPKCAVAEVCNTHGEMKMYLLDQTTFQTDTFRLRVPKLFYVSPFARLDSSFDFIFRVPGHSMLMRVDDYEENQRFLLSALSGEKKALTDARLLWYGVRFPLITLKISVLIFWQAFKLYLKKIPYSAKAFNMHLQQNMVRYKKANS